MHIKIDNKPYNYDIDISVNSKKSAVYNEPIRIFPPYPDLLWV